MEYFSVWNEDNKVMTLWFFFVMLSLFIIFIAHVETDAQIKDVHGFFLQLLPMKVFWRFRKKKKT
jgi:hypothetical protein